MKKSNFILGIIVFFISTFQFNVFAQDCDCGKLIESNFQIKGPKEICLEKCDSKLSFSTNSLPIECYKYSWKVTDANTGNAINIGGNGSNELILKCDQLKANQVYNIELTVTCGGKSITTSHQLSVNKCSVGDIKEVSITKGKDAEVRSNLGGGGSPVAPNLQNTNFGLTKQNYVAVWLASGELPAVHPTQGGAWEGNFFIDFKLPTDLTNENQIDGAKILLFADLVPNSVNFLTNSTKTNKFWVQRVMEPWGETTVTWANQPSVAPALTSAVVVPKYTGGGAADDISIDVTQLLRDSFHDNKVFGFYCTMDHNLGLWPRGRAYGSFQNPNPQLRPILILKYH